MQWSRQDLVPGGAQKLLGKIEIWRLSTVDILLLSDFVLAKVDWKK